MTTQAAVPEELVRALRLVPTAPCGSIRGSASS